MYRKIQCPSCNGALKVSVDMAGSKRVCPFCQGVLIVPSFSTSGREEPGEDVRIDLSGRNNKQRPTKHSSRSGSKSAAPAETSVVLKNADASNVSLGLSGLLGLVGAVLFYLALLPLHYMNVVVANKFWDLASIGINFPTTLLMFWCFAILFLKWRKLKRQRSAMLMDLLPNEISEEITTQSLDKFVAHIQSLPSDGANMLINRVLRGIEHFRVRKSASDTVMMMESQSAIDASNVAGSYTIIKVFIWSMPILGFIGTVMGVSQAVSGLSATLSNSGEMGALMDSMQGVFGGLGTAFDTTLLALIMSLIVKIPTTALQKSEDDLVTVVDEYCNENLLRRLNDKRDGGAARGSGGVVNDASIFREAVEIAMQSHHAELEKWVKKLAELTDQTAKLQTHVARSVSDSATTMGNQFSGLQKGLESLSRVLESLGQQQVIVQQVEVPAKKRRWFR